MWRQVPNLITTSRLLLSVVFFTLLSWYQWDGRGHSTLLTWAFFICLIAISTDYIDGYLARKWKVESAFGRVVDPFVDKILVLGSFIFFAGKNFIIPEPGIEHPYVVRTITGVTPMMVVIILGRELLVTSLRGMFESKGTNFGAVWAGKAKMVLQSVATLVIVAYVYFLALLKGSEWRAAYETWATLFRDVIIWATLIVTVWSCYGYIRRSIAVMRADDAAV